ncbi:MAG: acetyl-CoA C-acetyltransferase [Pseudomonadota bacterium]
MLHDGQSRRVAIIGGSRIPFARSHTAYRNESNLDMMSATLKALVSRFDLEGETLGEVSLGAVIKHSRDWNLAREATLSSGLAPQTPAFDLQRACGTGLSSCVMIANKIALGQIEAGIGGGCDTVSDPPIVYPDEYRDIMMRAYRARSMGDRIKPWFGLRPRHFKPELPGVEEPRTGLSMGQSTELTAKAWSISREDQDALALVSHQRAHAAWEAGFYDDLVTPHAGLERDNNIRSDSSMEKLAKLKPAFDRSPAGTMTAGNSTPLTDGASAVLLASEAWAKARNLPVLAYLDFCQASAVDFVNDEGLLMAPAYAVSEMMKRAQMTFEDIDLFEIHEAFAAQTLATMKAWESESFCRDKLGRDTPLGVIDRERLNIKGGSLAMGHPFAATGGRIVSALAKLLHERGEGRGLISICTAGGMGVTAILSAT